jgi:AraC-like DNA-binding protein
LAGELRLRRGAENFIGDWDPPVKGPVICGQDHSSFTLPRALLAVRIQPLAEAASAQAPAQAAASDQLPDSFISSVERLILAQLEDGMSQIELLAAACGISVRGMQRRLAEAGTSYRGMLSRVRHARARHWLEATDRPLSDIAEDLGYTDASNFARAFRRESGLSPSEFRRFSARQ